MCIIAYKERNKEMPAKSILEECFNNNPDGAGFMFVENDEVIIRKGYMTFSAFYSALLSKKYLWKSSPFVLHFRISTQAGVNKECTHPFPLSSNMNDLRQLKSESDIGIAHNGIISLTSNYTKNITHSDTMEFITDYLSIIIEDLKYYKKKNTLDLIEKLAGSKLAILDKRGHCELIGNFINDGGIYYSNTSYQKRQYKSYNYGWNDLDGYYSDYDYCGGYYSYHKEEKVNPGDKWENFKLNGKYYFDLECPVTKDNTYKYCSKCADFRNCYNKSISEEDMEELEKWSKGER